MTATVEKSAAPAEKAEKPAKSWQYTENTTRALAESQAVEPALA